MFLKPVVKALLVLSLTGAAHARVIPGQAVQLAQLEKLEQAVITEQTVIVDEAEQGELVEQDEHDTNDLSKSLPISYGKCYHIVTKKRDYLDHNRANRLVFADRENSGIFQV